MVLANFRECQHSADRLTVRRTASGKRSWTNRRQALPYRITEGLPVIREQSRDAPQRECTGRLASPRRLGA
jgi:hypothetical protein